MAEIGTAYVTLLPSAKGFGDATSKELGQSGSTGGAKAGKGFKSSFTKGVAGLGGAMVGLFAVDKVKDFFVSAVGEARESQKVSAITAQVIKTTGGAAQVSASQVGDLATSISNKTGIDDEAIQTGANLLLTFKNIRDEAGKGNDIFDQTTSIMTDMATSMGKDPKSAAIGLGKALNDPVKGVTALSKVGVTFDDSQKKMIGTMVASGNTMGAQKIILKELKSEFGGAAAASSTAGEKAGVAFGNLKEQIGTALLPVIDKVEGVISTKVIPAISTFLTQMQTGKGAGGDFADKVGKLVDTLVDLWGILQPIGKFLLTHLPIIYAVVAAIVAWQVAQLVFNAVQAIQLGLLMLVTPGTFLYAVASGIAATATGIWAAATWLLATPLGLIVLAIIALIVVIVLVIKYHKQIGAFIAKVWNKIKDAVAAAWHGVTAAISKAWVKIKSTISKALTATLGFIRKVWSRIVQIIASPFAAAIVVLVKNWGKIKSAISRALTALGAMIRGAWQRIVGIVSHAGQLLWQAVQAIPGKLLGLASRFASAGRSIITAFVNGLKNAGSLVSDIAGNVWNALKGLINSGISHVNRGLEFSISVLGKHVGINPPDIPPLAAGGRAKGSIVQVGDGRDWESIIPDRLMVQALTAAASSGQALGSGGGSNRLRLVVDGYEFNAYVDDRADAVVASAGALQDTRGRAAWR